MPMTVGGFTARQAKAWPIAQITMDVYGYPTVSVSRSELIHSDADDECPCDYCKAERDEADQ